MLSRFNRRLAAKVQHTRTAAPELIRHDQKQSLASLGAIAAMFGAGRWAYDTLGWGIAALTGILGTVPSFIASMLIFDAWFYCFRRLIHTRLFYRRVHHASGLVEQPATGWSTTCFCSPTGWSRIS